MSDAVETLKATITRTISSIVGGRATNQAPGGGGDKLPKPIPHRRYSRGSISWERGHVRRGVPDGAGGAEGVGRRASPDPL
jgi:hypothetical protein